MQKKISSKLICQLAMVFAASAFSMNVSADAPQQCYEYDWWQANEVYSGGDQVSNRGGVYECKGWPYSGWCGQVGYEPGWGCDWEDAWIHISECIEDYIEVCVDLPSWQQCAYQSGDRVFEDGQVYECKGYPTPSRK